MPDLPCSQVREMAPDVALGLLTGEARAAALAHLEGCAPCRAEVASLASVADEMLLTAPEATPPEGFAGRVLARLAAARSAEAPASVQGATSVVGPGSTEAPASTGASTGEDAPDRPRYYPHHHRRRVLGGAALAAAAAVVVLVAVVLVTRDDQPTTNVTAAMKTTASEVVGSATVRSGDPTTVNVDLPGWEFPDSGSGYRLAIELEDGSRTMASITTDRTSWEIPLEDDADEVASVSLLDADGWAWCSARFPD